MENLPIEIIYHILYYIDGKTLLTIIPRLSKDFYNISNDPILWRKLKSKGNLSINNLSNLSINDLPANIKYPWKWLWSSTNIPYKKSITGICKQITAKGTYEGEFRDGKKEGFGVFVSKNHKYMGYWLNDQRHGYGIEFSSDGVIYQGQFEDDIKTGFGELTLPDNSKYSGEFTNNKPHGFGSYVWSSGNSYQGQYFDGYMHGYGIHIWNTGINKGDRYEGYWHKSLFQNKGSYTWSDGRTYEGNYKKHKRNNYGVHKFPDGTMYKGNWLNDIRDGYGELITKSGQSYSGNWFNDHPIDNINDHWIGFFLLSNVERKNKILFLGKISRC